MKKFLGILLGVMLCVGFTAPAMADVFVFADINKDKDIFVLEEIFILKDIYVEVGVWAYPDGAAEAKALINQVNVEQDDFEDELNATNTMTGSVIFNTGIVGVNQASGHMNNQANVVAVAVTGALTAFADAQASAEQRMDVDNEYDGDSVVSTNSITTSILLNAGIVGVNQASSSFNNQLNAVAVAAGLGDGLVALAETDLGQFNIGNDVDNDDESVRSNFITNSINSNDGVVGVNQSAGVFNNQANMVSISVTPAPPAPN
jgi:hypothetical protein